jgi:hypothetical protein
MPHGGFPIENTADLKRAIQAVGRAKNPAAAKAWIIKRAKALGASDMLPDGWNVQESERGEMAIDYDMLVEAVIAIATAEALPTSKEIAEAADAIERMTGDQRGKLYGDDALSEAADSMAKASTPEPWSKSKTSNWVARAGGLPDYIQHISHDLHEKRGDAGEPCDCDGDRNREAMVPGRRQGRREHTRGGVQGGCRVGGQEGEGARQLTALRERPPDPGRMNLCRSLRPTSSSGSPGARRTRTRC